jgi:hypothetical protein
LKKLGDVHAEASANDYFLIGLFFEVLLHELLFILVVFEFFGLIVRLAAAVVLLKLLHRYSFLFVFGMLFWLYLISFAYMGRAHL